MQIIISAPVKMRGELYVPGDKSISHRAAMLGALAEGVTEVSGFLDAEDCLSTISCLRALGVSITGNKGQLVIKGRKKNFQQAGEPLYAGNSGTTARLLLGMLAGQPFTTMIIGDQSLCRRPMKRVIEPLSLMGAQFTGENDRLPLTINGGSLKPITFQTPQASAQVKSAILLAGLFAAGQTSVIEPAPSRNHTELMLDSFGAGIEYGGCRVTIDGHSELKGRKVIVPGDISAAAFFMVAGAIVPGSRVMLKDVGINQTRAGIIEALQQMGADIELKNKRLWGMEPVADIRVSSGVKLKGIELYGSMIPRLIDELPVLAVAAATAEGRTVIRDAGELRVKETDRISALSGELRKMGVQITETKDGMIIDGGADLKGAAVDSRGDHRIAMSLAVAGLAASGDTKISGAEAISISYPDFMAHLRSLVRF